jgi:hypothetical protein
MASGDGVALAALVVAVGEGELPVEGVALGEGATLGEAGTQASSVTTPAVPARPPAAAPRAYVTAETSAARPSVPLM